MTAQRGPRLNARPTVAQVFSKFLKYLWAFPVTFPGLIVAALTAMSGGSVRRVCGLVEAEGGFAKWLIERALRGKIWCATLGHVILARDADNLERMRAHERVHVAQYEKWGVLFIPLYVGSSLWAWSRGKHRYRDNIFEREAYAKAPEFAPECPASARSGGGFG